MKKTISAVKKNQINLFELKKLSEMKLVEKSFETFLKKNFFKNSKSKKKYLFKKKFCPCGSKLLKNKRKFFIRPFTFIQCNFCNTISIDPMINDKGLDIIYSKKGIYSLYSKVFFEKKTKKKLRGNVINQRKAEQVMSLFKRRNFDLLDFGCGDGGFLKCLKKNRIKNLTGIDKKFNNFEENNNIKFYNNLNIINKKFDCITLWGVLEHVNEPTKFIQFILNYLKPGGYLFMEFPSANSTLMHFIKNKNYDAPRFLEKGRHLYFFSKKFIEILCKKKKLKIIDIETNGLDIQTIIGPSKKIELKKIFNMQEFLDNNLLSDHYRVVLKKI
tara:strand:- start:900 stop:1886 length:987 start_codon:yes stop_codon:yes gene_type:complete